MKNWFEIRNANCLEVLVKLEENSIDSIITDPPYGLSFMGKKWDYDVPSVDIWRECLRVLKPGGHLLAFGGTRTYHRLVVAIEDAGFEIRDQIQWIYGQGFPKSQDISKAIDKAAGAERQVIGSRPLTGNGKTMKGGNYHQPEDEQDKIEKQAVYEFTAPATPEAKQWSGWGTALKPANEPICLARKPLSESTIAKNVLKHGTGGLNIDESRIGGPAAPARKGGDLSNRETLFEGGDRVRTDYESHTAGRFPSNVLLDVDAAAVLDEQSALNVSRFFYQAKASKSDRGEGNIHPTVKPIKLMEYLCKLVTPEGGTVLDPFMGSGTTGVAALRNGFDFIGCELEEAYFYICQARLEKECT